MINASHSLSNDNFLTINWTVNEISLCQNRNLSIIVTDKDCTDRCSSSEGFPYNACSIDCNHTVLNNTPVVNLSYTFLKVLKPCVRYNYSMMLIGNPNSEYNKSDNEIVGNKLYKSVANLSITITEDDVVNKQLNSFISWNYEYAECEPKFQVIVSGIDEVFEEMFEDKNETSGFNMTIKNLPACMNFTITVYPDQENISAATITRKSQFVEPSEIRNLTHREEGSNIFFSWIRPEFGAYCMEYYEFIAKNDDDKLRNDTTIQRNETIYILQNSYACVSYTITLTIISIDKDDWNEEETMTTRMTTLKTTTTIIPLRMAEPFEMKVATQPRTFLRPKHPTRENFTDTSFTLSTLLERTNNMCPIKNYRFSYKSEKMNETKFVESDIDTVTIDGLEAFTPYNCTAQIQNELSEWSEESYNEVIMTDEGSK